MELLQRKIMLKGRELGELAYLGYTQEPEGSVVRFLLATHYIDIRPLSDIIGKGKEFEVEVVANRQEKSFECLYVIKLFLFKKERVFTQVKAVSVSHPKVFLTSTVRKMVRNMEKAERENPREEAAF